MVKRITIGYITPAGAAATEARQKPGSSKDVTALAKSRIPEGPPQAKAIKASEPKGILAASFSRLISSVVDRVLGRGPAVLTMGQLDQAADEIHRSGGLKKSSAMAEAAYLIKYEGKSITGVTLSGPKGKAAVHANKECLQCYIDHLVKTHPGYKAPADHIPLEQQSLHNAAADVNEQVKAVFGDEHGLIDPDDKHLDKRIVAFVKKEYKNGNLSSRALIPYLMQYHRMTAEGAMLFLCGSKQKKMEKKYDEFEYQQKKFPLDEFRTTHQAYQTFEREKPYQNYPISILKGRTPEEAERGGKIEYRIKNP